MQLFDVAGMTCGHCVRAVTEAIQQVDPAATVQVDLKAGQARVESTATVTKLEDAIRGAGYEAHTSATA